ncbi:hypothetical protein C9412_04725 [Stenotrophomonas sp. Nf1]|nr:hypothetical protein C9412_04725 [Stenotrophomonas sp. Nf1]PTA82415.1 hypothetical protein C9416_04335 [Stenotrophomonas sp. Nf4]
MRRIPAEPLIIVTHHIGHGRHTRIDEIERNNTTEPPQQSSGSLSLSCRTLARLSERTKTEMLAPPRTPGLHMVGFAFSWIALSDLLTRA